MIFLARYCCLQPNLTQPLVRELDELGAEKGDELSDDFVQRTTCRFSVSIPSYSARITNFAEKIGHAPD
jgi:hypothetical protein